LRYEEGGWEEEERERGESRRSKRRRMVTMTFKVGDISVGPVFAMALVLVGWDKR
jgi:hypothetical protein